MEASTEAVEAPMEVTEASTTCMEASTISLEASTIVWKLRSKRWKVFIEVVKKSMEVEESSMKVVDASMENSTYIHGKNNNAPDPVFQTTHTTLSPRHPKPSPRKHTAKSVVTEDNRLCGHASPLPRFLVRFTDQREHGRRKLEFLLRFDEYGFRPRARAGTIYHCSSKYRYMVDLRPPTVAVSAFLAVSRFLNHGTTAIPSAHPPEAFYYRGSPLFF